MASEGYTKLFSTLTTSTIWSESLATRVVWITMLAMSNKDGEVSASVPGLARVANVTMAECESALAVFLSPDPYSRTPAHEGRRIETIPGGWRLLNHAKYRAKLGAEERREYKRKWQAEQRAKQESTIVHESPQVSTESTNGQNGHIQMQIQKQIHIQEPKIKDSCPADAEPVTTKTRFGEFWAAYPDKTGKKPSFEKWKSKRLDAIADKIVSDVNGRKARDRKWLDGFIPNPLTYLNQERWNDPIQEARPVQQQIRPMSKQEQGMAALMELRNEFMAGERDNRGRNETVRPLLGRDAFGDDDPGDGDGVD